MDEAILASTENERKPGSPPCNNPWKDDRTMNTVGGFLRHAWQLARPYFMEAEARWSARGLRASVIALSLTSVGLSVLLNFWRGAFYTALGEKDWDSFIELILFWCRNKSGFTFGFTLLASIHVVLVMYAFYLRQLLQIRWRRWLTEDRK